VRILLDTHILIWALLGSRKLPKEAANTIADGGNEVLFSAANIWEIAIKRQIGRMEFSMEAQPIADAAIETGFVELPVTSVAAAAVAELPLHHKDPFDRLLVCQALHEPARLFTVDPQLAAYGEIVTLL
jgi:PIN domain nuclease of toxin-antitoxin system